MLVILTLSVSKGKYEAVTKLLFNETHLVAGTDLVSGALRYGFFSRVIELRS